jgi:hypothetical protein
VRGDGLLRPNAGERPHLEFGVDLRVTAESRAMVVLQASAE